MAIPQPVLNIAEICVRHGLVNAVLSPGSRCTPLVIAFARHRKIIARTISDERSAAFTGLGMAQYSRTPTVLICTSGSAVYNYAPAIAEAYFQQIPLIVLTADRPAEWIDQLDGQTIRQQHIYGNHVKGSFELPVDHNHRDAQWHLYRSVNEALNLSKSFPQGPVHINVPLREPFYPERDEAIFFDEDVPVFTETAPAPALDVPLLHHLRMEWNASEKILIVGGQDNPNAACIELLAKLIQRKTSPVAGDIISNLHSLKDVICHHDLFLNDSNPILLENLRPELLITFGRSVISKNIKLFLRHYKPKAHWHIQKAGQVADTFQSLTKIIRCTVAYFVEHIALQQRSNAFTLQKQQHYFEHWQLQERKAIKDIEENIPAKNWGELNAYRLLIRQIPDQYQLHLANSMAVRYANMIGLTPSQGGICVFANRGTSGIDGSNSTAMGSAIASGRPTLLISGDMAFFYDRNAFWHNYDYPNLKIVVFNNHGGSIFNMIEGPSSQREYKTYFHTDQPLTAKYLAREFGFEYLLCDLCDLCATEPKLANAINAFFEIEKQPAILEIFTDSDISKKVLNQFKK